MDKGKARNERGGGASFRIGAMAIVFLAIGFQLALFIHRTAVIKIMADRDAPDTVYVYATERAAIAGKDNAVDGRGGARVGDGASATHGSNPSDHRRTERHDAIHSRIAEEVHAAYTPRSYECFPFDPNTASTETLQRLGFSARQAQAIDNYRKKGGRFRRKGDFAKSYVVDDSVFRRLEPYIRIPKLDINEADSAGFETLPGIGPYFAAKMAGYRDRLGGSYSYPEQLMDIPKFDKERYDALSDLITIGSPRPYRLWSLPGDSLALHPYIGRQAAHGIIIYKEGNPKDKWTVEGLREAGVLKAADAERLARCIIAEP